MLVGTDGTFVEANPAACNVLRRTRDLCDECAKERGVDVNRVATPRAGEVHCCEDCGNPNRAASP